MYVRIVGRVVEAIASVNEPTSTIIIQHITATSCVRTIVISHIQNESRKARLNQGSCSQTKDAETRAEDESTYDR